MVYHLVLSFFLCPKGDCWIQVLLYLLLTSKNKWIPCIKISVTFPKFCCCFIDNLWKWNPFKKWIFMQNSTNFNMAKISKWMKIGIFMNINAFLVWADLFNIFKNNANIKIYEVWTHTVLKTNCETLEWHMLLYVILFCNGKVVSFLHQ